MTKPVSGTQSSAVLNAQWGDTYRFLEQRLGALTDEIAVLRAERRAQSEAHEALAMRLRGVLDALPGAVIVLNGAGRVADFNPAAAALFDMPLADALWRDVIVQCFVPRQGHDSDLSLRNGRVVTLATCPLGAAPGQILLFQDVTEFRRAQQSMERQQRLIAMGQMAANLAHQIRTPLSAALLYASQLSRGSHGAEQRQRFANNTVASLKKLERLIANMLLFTRGAAGGEEPQCTADLLADLTESVQPLLTGKRIELQLDNHCRDAWVRGNRALLVSALENLVGNALQAMGENGRLCLFCRPAPDHALDIGVQDDGPGVPAELHQRLFEPFTSGSSRGTGLGLAIVRAVAQAHHGDAWFVSQPGDTRFALRLPAGAALPEEHSEVA